MATAPRLVARIEPNTFESPGLQGRELVQLNAARAFFTWGLVSGTQESFQYGETLVQMPTLPIWPVYAVCAVLCALACLITVFVAVTKLAGRT